LLLLLESLAIVAFEGMPYVHELIVGSSIDPTNLTIVSAVVKNSLLLFFFTLKTLVSRDGRARRVSRV